MHALWQCAPKLPKLHGCTALMWCCKHYKHTSHILPQAGLINACHIHHIHRCQCSSGSAVAVQ